MKRFAILLSLLCAVACGDFFVPSYETNKVPESCFYKTDSGALLEFPPATWIRVSYMSHQTDKWNMTFYDAIPNPLRDDYMVRIDLEGVRAVIDDDLAYVFSGQPSARVTFYMQSEDLIGIGKEFTGYATIEGIAPDGPIFIDFRSSEAYFHFKFETISELSFPNN